MESGYEFGKSATSMSGKCAKNKIDDQDWQQDSFFWFGLIDFVSDDVL